MGMCYKVPADAWLQLEHAQWPKLKRACFQVRLGGRCVCFLFLEGLKGIQTGEGQERRAGPLDAWPPTSPKKFSHGHRRPRCFSRDSPGAAGATGLLAVLGSCRQLEDPSKTKKIRPGCAAAS